MNLDGRPRKRVKAADTHDLSERVIVIYSFMGAQNYILVQLNSLRELYSTITLEDLGNSTEFV